MEALTTEEFTKKAKAVHGDLYDYSKSVYTLTKNRITVTCPKHGDFEIIARNHLRGSKCIKCSACSTTAEFTNKANEVHGNRYDYSCTKYIDVKHKVTILCHTHGKFKQNPSDHLSGKGCNQCGRDSTINSSKMTNAEFISKASNLHACKYSYLKTKYIRHNEKVIITCPVHGDFEQKPFQHLQSQGCQLCANRLRGSSSRKEEPAIVYSIYLPDYNVWKIGITAKSVGVIKRYKSEKVNYTLLHYFDCDTGRLARTIERAILIALGAYQYTGEPLLTSGNTELLTKDPTPILKELLKEYND